MNSASTPYSPMRDNSEFMQFTNMQRALMSLTNENIHEIKGKLTEKGWFSTTRKVYQVGRTILKASRYRSQHIYAYALLTDKIHCESEMSDVLKRVLMRYMFRSLCFIKPFPKESVTLAFLFYCHQLGVFTEEEIVSKIRVFHKNNRRFTLSNIWLFIWFAPEIEKHNCKLFEALSNMANLFMPSSTLPPTMSRFIKDIDQYKKDNWARLRCLRHYHNTSSTFTSCIKRDDLREMMELVIVSKNGLNTHLSTSLFSPYYGLQYKPSLAQTAAFFGASTCLKYLKTTSSVKLYDKNGWDLTQFLIACGLPCRPDCCDTYSLHTCALFHRPDLFRWLVEKLNFPMKNYDSKGYLPCHRAAESNCIEVINYWVLMNSDVNEITLQGETMLHIAVRYGNIDACRYLLAQKGINVDCTTNEGVTPFHLAAKYGDVEIAGLLLSNGFRVLNALNRMGESALFLAAKCAQKSMIRFLLGIPEVSIHSSSLLLSPLFYLIYLGQLELVKIILSQKGADPNVTLDGYTPLLFAVKHGKAKIVSFILSLPDCDPMKATENMFSPLHLAVKRENTNIINILLADKRVDPNSKNSIGIAPLHRAVSFNKYNSCAALLSSERVDPNVLGQRDETPFYLAVCMDNVELVSLFVACPRVDINITSCGKSPLYRAVQYGQYEIIRMLLSRFDVNPNLRSKDDDFPLAVALRNGDVSVLSLLLQRPDLKLTCDFTYIDKHPEISLIFSNIRQFSNRPTLCPELIL